MPHFSEIATVKLDLEYPTTLEARQKVIASSPIKQWPRFIDIDRTKREHFVMLNLIREHDILQCLPYAMCMCATPDYKDTREIEPCSLFSPNPSSHPDERYLSTMDHCACMRGQKIMCQLLFQETFSWMKHDGICNKPTCVSFKASLLSQHVSLIKLGHAFLIWPRIWEGSLCAECIPVCRSRHNQGAQNVWNQLPSIFGLRPWEELTGTGYVCFRLSMPAIDEILRDRN